METIFKRIHHNTLFITTRKGAFYVDLGQVKNASREQSIGVLYPYSFVKVLYRDNTEVRIETGDIEEAKDVFGYILAQWEDYLHHDGVYENSSNTPSTRVLNDKEIILTWGAHTLLIDLSVFNVHSLGLGMLTLSGVNGKLVLTSSQPDYLVRLKEALALHLQRKK